MAEGKIQLSVSGAVITDVGQPVYATDDDTFVFSPVAASFVGFVDRFVSAGVSIVKFDVNRLRDPYAEYSVRETHLGQQDPRYRGQRQGVFRRHRRIVITMPAVATPVNCKIVNIGAFGAVKLSRSARTPPTRSRARICRHRQHRSHQHQGDARRGDFVKLVTGDANGPIVASCAASGRPPTKRALIDAGFRDLAAPETSTTINAPPLCAGKAEHVINHLSRAAPSLARSQCGSTPATAPTSTAWR
jgi:hypothetical protein